MRTVVAAAPHWVQATIQAALAALVWIVIEQSRNGYLWWHTVVVGTGFGLVLGVTNFVARREDRAVFERSLPPLTRQQRRSAFRAAVRGPVPDDALVLRAAIDIAADEVEQCTRGRAREIALMLCFAVVCVLYTVSGSSWYALGLVALTVVPAQMWWVPARYRRRLAQLQNA